MASPTSSTPSFEDLKHHKIKIAIVGAGLSGLALANGLLKDLAGRYDVHIYERDTIAFDSERGGYQIRINGLGLQALKSVSDSDVWNALREAWAGDEARAPAIVDPNFNLHLRLANLKLYPTSRPVPREGLRRALLQPLLKEGRVHFGHRLERFEYGIGGGVRLYFQNDVPAQDADILIAADGSNSLINRLVGLNNKTKLQEWTLIQARGSIGRDIRDKLPKSLLDSGSIVSLAAGNATGFASVYDRKTETGGPAGKESYTLFWSVLVPSARGNLMTQEAGDDPMKVLPPLLQYFRQDLGLNESFPFIMQSATQHLRMGLLTSSVKPDPNWRNGNPAKARVILMGDAIHPMTPGRGQGANQALTDALKLTTLFHNASFEHDVPSDGELASLVRTFDTEMYERAFKMVKASAQVMSLDLTKTKDKILLSVVGAVLTVIGWGVSALEFVGLRTPETLDFVSQNG